MRRNVADTPARRIPSRQGQLRLRRLHQRQDANQNCLPSKMAAGSFVSKSICFFENSMFRVIISFDRALMLKSKLVEVPPRGRGFPPAVPPQREDDEGSPAWAGVPRITICS